MDAGAASGGDTVKYSVGADGSVLPETFGWHRTVIFRLHCNRVSDGLLFLLRQNFPPL